MIIFDGDKVKKTYGKDINALRKRAKTVKTKKGRTIKMYAMNIERKKLLKQRRKKALQNAKLAKENSLTAVKASHKAERASKDTQSGTKPNDGLINSANADTITHVDDIDNIEIVAENAVNATTNAENIDTDSTNADNIVNVERENDNSEDIVMNVDNINDTAMIDNHTSDAILGNDNAENVAPCEISTNDVPSPLLYVRKITDPSKVKTSKMRRPIRVKPLESSMDDPPADENVTGTAKGHAFDPTDE